MRSRFLLPALAAFLWPLASTAQFTLNCPPNTIVSTDSATCDAVVSYPAPYITGGPTNDTTFAFTGSVQMYVIPANIGQVTVECWGAQGNGNTGSPSPVFGGLGGYSTGDLIVTPGETLYVYVGGGGNSNVATGGYNGGGNGGVTVNCAISAGGGGGGASDVRQGGQALADRVIVAGGGGGAGGNRNQGCGRGSGGGGGGGYYGGGGGAGWPSTSTVLPTGGTQTAGGTGGTSAFTGAPNNAGGNGALGIGGTGGEEVGSNQGGSATAAPGGSGGGTTGGPGVYNSAANWTGQSGAGGSGYIGGVSGGSMQDGVRTGNGQVRITYSVSFTLTQTAGIASGGTFPPGSTTNAFHVQQGANQDSCSFTLTVEDSIAPVVQGCPGMDTIYADANCGGPLADYTTLLTFTDNCTATPIATQLPAPGTTISGAGSVNNVDLIVSDSLNNSDTCSFQVVVLDTTAPAILSCPPATVFIPTTFDCNPQVNFSAPTFQDNCAASVVGSHQPGDNFQLGTTVISYTAMDSSGNSTVCSFTLTVANPVVDGFVTQSPAAACVGDSVTFQASPGYTYAWSNGSTAQSITVTAAGNYWVDLTDTSNCIARDSVNLTFNQPMPTLTPNGASLCTGTNFASYQWYQNGTLIPGATTNCYLPTTDGTFQVIVLDSAGCQGISDTLFFVGVEAALNNPGFEMFPNPAQNQLNIRMLQPLTAAGTIVLYDLTGRAVYREAFDQLSGTTVIDLGRVSAGTYIVEIKAENFLGRRRLLRLE